MIYKEIDPKDSNNRLIQAGVEAEKQMAFYLKRAFAEEEKIIVLNDLRIIVDDEVAQIDHLVVHAFGFIVIESKSVTTEVIINEYDEWSRVYSGQKQGMPSPIKQAERQIEILKKLLDNYADEIFMQNFLNKLLKPKFSTYNFDILVAISDHGIIERSNKKQSKNIFKADQITDEVKKIIKHYFVQNINPLLMIPHQESQVTLIERTAKFLKDQHQSLTIIHQEDTKQEQAQKVKSLSKPMATHMRELSFKHKIQGDQNTPLCSKCQSPNLEIRYGKYGYYFKCLFCDGNTAIKLQCKNTDCKPRLQKRGLVFSKICDVCGEEKHFFTNKDQVVDKV